MCGIVGYVGSQQAAPILLDGLSKLEYRGYDSAGLAVRNGTEETEVIKAKGRLKVLFEKTNGGAAVPGTCGIGHTRWATHGEPSENNAHPHMSDDGNVVAVHNGIIENYQELKNKLLRKGYTFYSETDTEVAVKLIDYYYKKYEGTPVDAINHALVRIRGSYALAMMFKDYPEEIYVARKDSPMILGVSDGESYIASDVPAILKYTRNVYYIGNLEMARVRKGEITFYNLDGEEIQKQMKTIEWDAEAAEKGGFEHFMLKEIYDQPQCLKDCMSGRLFADKDNPSNNHIVLSALTDYKDRLMSAKHIIIVACGTSWHAALIGKQLIEKMCRKRVEVEYASEFRYGEPVIESDDVVIAISQSGETADTLAAIQLAKQHGALIFGIVNGVGSSIARETDTGIYIHVGPEIGVASTKAFTGQVTVLTLFALALGHELGTLSEKDYVETIAELAEIPSKMEKVLEQTPSISRLAKVFTYAHNFLYLGRGFNYPVALEGALKLKEISYIHAEGYPAAEMKHGPIALVDTDMPIVFLATHHQLYEKIISNMQEVKSRNGRILAIVTEGDKQVKAIADSVIEVPQTLNTLVPLLSVVPLQILAYYVAVDKGLNVDMPRNLAKSVTVE